MLHFSNGGIQFIMAPLKQHFFFLTHMKILCLKEYLITFKKCCLSKSYEISKRHQKQPWAPIPVVHATSAYRFKLLCYIINKANSQRTWKTRLRRILYVCIKATHIAYAVICFVFFASALVSALFCNYTTNH